MDVKAMNEWVPGAIVDSSWGYDQTNRDFYMIDKVTDANVWLVPILCRIEKDNGNMSAFVVPVGEPKPIGSFELGSPGGKWDGKPIRRKLRRGTDGRVMGVAIKHGWANLWDGTPSYSSWYA